MDIAIIGILAMLGLCALVEWLGRKAHIWDDKPNRLNDRWN